MTPATSGEYTCFLCDAKFPMLMGSYRNGFPLLAWMSHFNVEHLGVPESLAYLICHTATVRVPKTDFWQGEYRIAYQCAYCGENLGTIANSDGEAMRLHMEEIIAHHDGNVGEAILDHFAKSAMDYQIEGVELRFGPPF